MGIPEIYEKLSRFAEYELERQKSARLAIEKINTFKLLVANTGDLEKIRYKQSYSIYGTVLGSLSLAALLARHWFTRFFVVGIGMISVKTFISPYYLAEMMECVAEKPTEAGQAVRAIFLFKMPSHPKFSHYEGLSKDYRKYTVLKDKV